VAALASVNPPQVVPATSAADVAAVHELFLEYADSLGFDLAFQDFEDELRRLPGEYGPPRGALLLARRDEEAVGCVGVRPLDPATCELKRLFVRPTARGGGVGRALTEAAVETARELGYERMRLDTVPAMGSARALYRSLGFHEIESYRHNPIPGTSFMELALHSAKTPEPPALG
jgi:GNAT superfamily N-acetyltransferase